MQIVPHICCVVQGAFLIYYNDLIAYCNPGLGHILNIVIKGCRIRMGNLAVNDPRQHDCDFHTLIIFIPIDLIENILNSTRICTDVVCSDMEQNYFCRMRDQPVVYIVCNFIG